MQNMSSAPSHHRTPPAPADPLDPSALPPAHVPALYIHVPFCAHKCLYCDFYSLPAQPPQRLQRYVDLLLAEANLHARNSPRPLLRPETVFIGGGTPTLLPLNSMRNLLRGLRQTFDLSLVNEWTIEANPATVTPDYCAMLADQRITRLSFGAQSFRTQDLAFLDRLHNPRDVAESIQIARAAGFTRLNLDLIYAIPDQDLAAWTSSLQAAVALDVQHISCYGLTYETGTPLSLRKQQGTIRPATDELELQMLHHARRCLAAAGYEPYEISNYARPGEQCRHNLLYWNGGNYLGLGPAAASHLDGLRWRNRPDLTQWEHAIHEGTLPATDVEQLSPPRRAGELAMLQLRLAAGVSFSRFAAQTGFDPRSLYSNVLDRLANIGLINLDQQGFRLTDRGIDLADAVAAEFLQTAPDGPP